MDIFKAKYLTLLLSFTLIFGAGIGALLYYKFPNFYPQWYPAILIFFYILEAIIIYTVDVKSKKLKQIKMVNMYMLTKGIKMFISLVFIGLYALIVKTELKNFVLVFVLFYFLYLLFETYCFTIIEKRIINVTKNQK